MAFWSKIKPDKSAHPEPQPTQQMPTSEEDERLPGIAGYKGYGIGKNAMPERRFNFKRPGDQQ